MMRTTFVNVGHGETIFIKLFEKKLYGIVRDFGRSRFAKHTDFSSSLKRIINCKNCCPLFGFYLWHPEKIDAVLSHAHEDHFNGFKMLYDIDEKEIFQNAYIPWLKMTDLNSLGGLLIKYSIFLYRYYSLNTTISHNAQNWLLATPVMAALSKKLWCVSAGHNVKQWDQKNRILWPLPVTKKYDKDLEDRWTKYLKKNNLPDNFLEEEAEKIRKYLSHFYSESPEEQEGLENNEELIENTIATIISIITEPLPEQLITTLSSPIGLNNYSYKPTIDNHSLIFEIGEKENETLFLSDADDKTVESMLQYNGIKKKNYNLIKSGHHGNRGGAALKNQRITSDAVINCCGPSHPNWKGPDQNYKNVSSTLLCTDWHDNSGKWANKSAFFIPEDCFIDF